MTAAPLPDGLAAEIEDGKVTPRDDPKARKQKLCSEFEFDATDARGSGPLDQSLLEQTCSLTPPRECSTSTRSRTPALLASSGPPRRESCVTNTCVVSASM